MGLGTRGEAQARPQGLRPEHRRVLRRPCRVAGDGYGPKRRDCPTPGRAGRGDRIRSGLRRAHVGPTQREQSPCRECLTGRDCGRRGWKRSSRTGQCGPQRRGSTLKLGDNRGACVYSFIRHSTRVLCAKPPPAAPRGAGHTARGGPCSPESPSCHRLQGRWRLRPGPRGGGERGGGHLAVEPPVRPPQPGRATPSVAGRGGSCSGLGWRRGGLGWGVGGHCWRLGRTPPPIRKQAPARPPSASVVRGLAPVAAPVLLPASGDLVQLLRRLPVDGPVPATGGRGPRSCGPPAYVQRRGWTVG